MKHKCFFLGGGIYINPFMQMAYREEKIEL